MATNYFNGTIDLGNTPEMFAAYAHFGSLSPDKEYDALHGSLHAVLDGCEDVHPENIRRLKQQIFKFQEEFSEDLSEHENWILDQLMTA